MKSQATAFGPRLVWIVTVSVACTFWGCDQPENEEDTVQDQASRYDGTADLGRGDVGTTDLATDLQADIAPPREEIPILAGEAFSTRKEAYLHSCSDSNGPGEGGLYGQTCRLMMGETTFNEEVIAEGLLQMTNREDTSDFRLVAFARILYLDNKFHGLPAALRSSIEETLFGFRYWLTEPGNDKMCYWTENHQVLFHSGELLLGQLYPDQVFSNSGMTGAEHVAHAEPLLLRWLDFRGKIGFSEWHSNVYFNEDLPALLNLAEYAENAEIRAKAAMVLDVLLIDMLANTYKGYFAVTHGRTYSSKYLNGLKDSTTPYVWLAAGVGETTDYGNFAAAFLATNEVYVPPPMLEEWAGTIASSYEHRQRDSIDVEEAAEWGVGYLEPQDILFWAGMSAILEPDVVYGFIQFLNKYSLWDGFLVGDIEEPYRGMLVKMGENPQSIRDLAVELEVVTRGLTLGSANTYTYRTPYYQLSGVQDYKAGLWSAQTLSWIATLDGQAFVISSLPGNPEMIGEGQEFGDGWVGGWQPRVTLHRSVGVIQYRTRSVPLFGETFNTEWTHALFPQVGFDEIKQTDHWVCGRKGDGYVCLGSQTPLAWSSANEMEIVAETNENIFVVQMGSKEESGEFADFVTQVTEAELTFEEGVTRFDSPMEGMVQVGWEGPMFVDGAEVDLGPYERFEGEHVNQTWGDGMLTLAHEGKTLELDFDAGTRHVWAEE